MTDNNIKMQTEEIENNKNCIKVISQEEIVDSLQSSKTQIKKRCKLGFRKED